MPKYINPLQLAQQGTQLKGTCLIKELDRLSPLVTSPDAKVSFQLTFQRNEEGASIIQGEIKTTLSMICQRCGEPMEWDLKVQPSLAVVSEENQINQIPEDYEPLITHGQPVLLLSIIEDELILALPMIPKHPLGKCDKPLPDYLC